MNTEKLKKIEDLTKPLAVKHKNDFAPQLWVMSNDELEALRQAIIKDFVESREPVAYQYKEYYFEEGLSEFWNDCKESLYKTILESIKNYGSKQKVRPLYDLSDWK